MSLSSLRFLLLISPGLTVGEGPLVAAAGDVSVPCFLSASFFNLLNWGTQTQTKKKEKETQISESSIVWLWVRRAERELLPVSCVCAVCGSALPSSPSSAAASPAPCAALFSPGPTRCPPAASPARPAPCQRKLNSGRETQKRRRPTPRLHSQGHESQLIR